MITRKPRKGDVLDYQAMYPHTPTRYIVAETPQGDDTICRIYDPLRGDPSVPQTWTLFIYKFHDGWNSLFTIIEPTDTDR